MCDSFNSKLHMHRYTVFELKLRSLQPNSLRDQPDLGSCCMFGSTPNSSVAGLDGLLHSSDFDRVSHTHPQREREKERERERERERDREREREREVFYRPKHLRAFVSEAHPTYGFCKPDPSVVGDMGPRASPFALIGSSLRGSTPD